MFGRGKNPPVIGGDDYFVNRAGIPASGNDMRDKRPPEYIGQDLAGKSSGTPARGNDYGRPHRVSSAELYVISLHWFTQFPAPPCVSHVFSILDAEVFSESPQKLEIRRPVNPAQLPSTTDFR